MRRNLAVVPLALHFRAVSTLGMTTWDLYILYLFTKNIFFYFSNCRWDFVFLLQIQHTPAAHQSRSARDNRIKVNIFWLFRENKYFSSALIWHIGMCTYRNTYKQLFIYKYFHLTEHICAKWHSSKRKTEATHMLWSIYIYLYILYYILYIY